MPSRLLRVSVLIFAFPWMIANLNAQGNPERDYGRSMVVTQYGIVATSYVQASQAGARILEQGGSAIDAGIAANAVLGVAEPMMNGIGGDLFAIYWDAKTGKLYGLNASGWAPRGLTIGAPAKQGHHQMPEFGIDTVTVPGAVEGWAKLHGRFGKLPWAQLFAPAIFHARNGYPVPEMLHGYWQAAAAPPRGGPRKPARLFCQTARLLNSDRSFAIQNSRIPLTSSPARAETLSTRAPIAQSILKTSAELGGTMTAEDLARVFGRMG